MPLKACHSAFSLRHVSKFLGPCPGQNTSRLSLELDLVPSFLRDKMNFLKWLRSSSNASQPWTGSHGAIRVSCLRGAHVMDICSNGPIR